MPDPAADLTTVLTDLAAAPASVTVGDRTAAEHRLPDLIALDKHLAGKAAAAAVSPATGRRRSPLSLLRPAVAVPPGGA